MCQLHYSCATTAYGVKDKGKVFQAVSTQKYADKPLLRVDVEHLTIRPISAIVQNCVVADAVAPCDCARGENGGEEYDYNISKLHIRIFLYKLLKYKGIKIL